MCVCCGVGGWGEIAAFCSCLPPPARPPPPVRPPRPPPVIVGWSAVAAAVAWGFRPCLSLVNRAGRVCVRWEAAAGYWHTSADDDDAFERHRSRLWMGSGGRHVTLHSVSDDRPPASFSSWITFALAAAATADVMVVSHVSRITRRNGWFTGTELYTGVLNYVNVDIMAMMIYDVRYIFNVHCAHGVCLSLCAQIYLLLLLLLPFTLQGAVLLTAGRSYVGNDVTHSTLSVFQLGIFLRALRPARFTSALPEWYKQKNYPKKLLHFFPPHLQNVIAVVFSDSRCNNACACRFVHMFSSIAL